VTAPVPPELAKQATFGLSTEIRIDMSHIATRVTSLNSTTSKHFLSKTRYQWLSNHRCPHSSFPDHWMLHIRWSSSIASSVYTVHDQQIRWKPSSSPCWNRNTQERSRLSFDPRFSPGKCLLTIQSTEVSMLSHIDIFIILLSCIQVDFFLYLA
jgi:hypothetical protein